MKTNIFILFFLIACVFFVMNAGAQAPAEPPLLILDVSEPPVRYTPATVIAQLSASATQGEGLFAPQNIQLNLTAAATQGLSKIAVLLGSSPGSNDVFYKEFDPAQQGQFDDGTSLQRNGTSLNIGISNTRAALPLYAEVFALLNDGTRSLSRRATVE